MLTAHNDTTIAVVNTFGLFPIWSMIVGLALGSFINALAFRLPRGISLLTRSCCRDCETAIPFYRNIPLVSYLLLRGRGSCCGGSIPVHYPFVEGLLGFVYFFIAYRFGFAPFSLSLFLLSFFALAAATADLDTALDPNFETGIIPDSIIVFGIISGLVLSFATAGIAGVSSAVFSGVVGFGILFLPTTIYGRLRNMEMMGFGDYKLMGMLCLYLTPFGAVFVMLFASIFGILVGIVIALRRGSLRIPIPFAPMLGVSAVVYALFSTPIHRIFFTLAYT